MGAINTTRSNIKNSFRTAGGTEVDVETVTEVTEGDGRTSAQVSITITFDGKSETHRISVGGKREKK